MPPLTKPLALRPSMRIPNTTREVPISSVVMSSLRIA